MRHLIFNGEIKNGQEAEDWLLGMRKYFQVQDYSRNMDARFSIFNLNGRASIWWEHLRQVKKINDEKMCGNNLISISNRSTSLIGIMMTRSMNSMI